MSNCDWLPELITLDQYAGEWAPFIAAIYGLYYNDFVSSRPAYPGRRFGLKRYPLQNGWVANFYHLVSNGPDEPERTPDLRRCERVRWPRPIIEAVQTRRVLFWEQKRRNETRLALALEDFSYIVVLADRGDYVLLWTTFCVETEHTKKTYRKEYEAYNSQKTELAPPTQK